MSRLNWVQRISDRTSRIRKNGPCADLSSRGAKATVESLESRTLLSESASAQLSLVSTTGMASAPIFNYAITLKDTGTTNIGTFWFAWVPGEDFLPSQPLSQSSPSGWTASLTGSHNSADGTAIQWVAGSAAVALTPGQSLSGFTFSSNDSPSALAGISPTHPTEPVETSFVYIGAPLTDPGFQFAVTNAVTTPTTGALVPSIAKSTLPSAVVTGAPVKGTVTVNVSNSSSATVTGSSMVEVFASNDGAIDSSAILLGQVTRTLNIKNGKSSAVPIAIKSLPAALTDGHYTLLARAIDPSANASDSATGPTLEVAAGFISLSEVFSRQTLASSVAAGEKTHAVAALKITNSGNIPSTGSTMVAIDLSPDGLLSDATTIATVTKTLHILPGKSIIVSVPLGVVPMVALGSYSVVAQVTDPDQQISSVVSSMTVTVGTAPATAPASPPPTSPGY